MNIVGLAGCLGSGKDYQADLLVKQGYKKISFADMLREAVWTVFGWRPETPEEYEKFKKATVMISDPDFYVDETVIHATTGREILQRFGTEFGRKMIGQDVWVDMWEKKVNGLRAISRGIMGVVTADARFPNEIMKISSLGGQIKFCNYKSERYKTDILHESELFANILLKMNYSDGDIVKPDDIDNICITWGMYVEKMNEELKIKS